uniref:Uncharacterized protein n=1 Tax=Anguilla anguilla TaxID=7936 RepID=A0A0E9SDV9_ANGAN
MGWANAQVPLHFSGIILRHYTFYLNSENKMCCGQPHLVEVFSLVFF